MCGGMTEAVEEHHLGIQEASFFVLDDWLGNGLTLVRGDSDEMNFIPLYKPLCGAYITQGSLSEGVIAGIVAGSAVVIVIICTIAFCIIKRHQKNRKSYWMDTFSSTRTSGYSVEEDD
jgi:hypothetical protein